MIETALLNYGIAGLWLAYMIIDRATSLKKMTDSLDRNTEAIESMLEWLRISK